MRFHSKRLADGRWGIYEADRFLATVGCAQDCRRIIVALKQRQLEQASLQVLPPDRQLEQDILLDEPGLASAPANNSSCEYPAQILNETRPVSALGSDRYCSMERFDR